MTVNPLCEKEDNLSEGNFGPASGLSVIIITRIHIQLPNARALSEIIWSLIFRISKNLLLPNRFVEVYRRCEIVFDMAEKVDLDL